MLSVGDIGQGERDRQLALRLLSILKHFYTYKELESSLGIPYQRLWRYVALSSIPEKSTADKIVTGIVGMKLFERALAEALQDDAMWKAARNIGLLQLASLAIEKSIDRRELDVVVSFPDEYSAALAAILAEDLGAALCIASRSPAAKNVLAEVYASRATGRADVIALPSGCLEKNDHVLLSTIRLDDPNLYYAVMGIVERARAIVSKGTAIEASRRALAELAKRGIAEGMVTSLRVI